VEENGRNWSLSGGVGCRPHGLHRFHPACMNLLSASFGLMPTCIQVNRTRPCTSAGPVYAPLRLTVTLTCMAPIALHYSGRILPGVGSTGSIIHPAPRGIWRFGLTRLDRSRIASHRASHIASLLLAHTGSGYASLGPSKLRR
jgi:hypothetical protein